MAENDIPGGKILSMQTDNQPTQIEPEKPIAVDEQVPSTPNPIPVDPAPIPVPPVPPEPIKPSTPPVQPSDSGGPNKPIIPDGAVITARSKSPAGKWIITTIASLIAVLVVAVGLAAAAYRFTPNLFFANLPSGFTSRVNSLWPLHSSYSEMIPANSLVYGMINLSAGQNPTVAKLMTETPGLSSLEQAWFKNLNTDLAQNYDGLSVSQDITPAFGTRIYYSSTDSSGGSVYLAVPVVNQQKLVDLASKLSNSGNKDQFQKTTHGGVAVYLSKQLNTPSVGLGNLVSFNQLDGVINQLAPTPTTIARLSNRCGGQFSACADQTVSTSSASYNGQLAMAEMDNYLIIASSPTGLYNLIDFDHSSKQDSLAATSGFQTAANAQIAAGYLNLSQIKQTSLAKVTAGFDNFSISLGASSGGWLLNLSAAYEPDKLDAETAKIVSSPSQTSHFATLTPSTVSAYYEGSDVTDQLDGLAAIPLSGNQTTTVDQYFDQALGVKLSDLAATISGRFAVSLDTEPKLALVWQSQTDNPSAAQALLGRVFNHLSRLGSNLFNQASERVGNQTIYELRLADSNSDPLLAAYFAPSFSVLTDRLIISTTPQALKATLQPTNSLSNQPLFQTGQQELGSQGQSVFYLNSFELNQGLSSTLADTGYSNLTGSGEPNWTGSYPGLYGSGRVSNNQLTDQLLIPVEPGETADAKRMSDLQSILAAVKTGSFKQFETAGQTTKLDPNQGVMQQMITDKALSVTVNDPSWPIRYYSLYNDGQTARAYALFDQKPAGQSCEPAQQIHGKWLWCASISHK